MSLCTSPFAVNRAGNIYAGVGIVLFNPVGKVLVGQRLDMQSDAWQMPQGGIDADETPGRYGAKWKKRSVRATPNCQNRGWFTYKLPLGLKKYFRWKIPWSAAKMVCFPFFETDQDINIQTPHPEFRNWQWVEFQEF